MTSKEQNFPNLAAPGAGIPRIERFVANLMIRFQAATSSREQITALFQAQESEIRKRFEKQKESSAQPVLIKRIPGLEDSSRYWSLLMVLDHLKIVNQGIAEVIAELGADRLPSREIRIADVKPSSQVSDELIAHFHQSCRDFLRIVAEIPDLKTKATFTHPWFGAMDAHTWYFMAAFHMQLHRRQIDLISAGLKKS